MKSSPKAFSYKAFPCSPPASRTSATSPQAADAVRRITRLFKILTLVRSRSPGQPLGAGDLALECGCDLRTLLRDIALLKRQAGVPLDYDRREKAYLLPDKGWAYPIAPLLLEDVLALALMQGLMLRPGMPGAEAIAAALAKATASLPTGLRALLAAAAESLHIGPSPRDYSQLPLDLLQQAVAQKETLELDYHSRSRGERSLRQVDPYGLEARAGQFWELHGWCHRRQAIRTFALDQASALQKTGVRFVRDEAAWEAFAAQQGIVGGLRGAEPVTVDVRFTPEVAAYARDQRWAETLHLDLEDDGSARLTGTVLGTEGLVTELLRWRRHCRVIGGPELWAAMQAEIAAIAALYED